MIHEQKTRLHSSDNLYVNHSFLQLQKKAQFPAGQSCKEPPAVGRMPLYLCPVRFSHQAVTSPLLRSTGDARALYHLPWTILGAHPSDMQISGVLS